MSDPVPLPPGLVADVRAWIADDVDPAAADELRALHERAVGGDGSAGAELADRFAGPLTFGTAGLRGPLRAGPNGMNRTVVRRAASGLAAWLQTAGYGGAATGRGGPAAGQGGVVVVGYDARHGSAAFARDSAAILAAAGFDARLLPGPLPTPVLAYSVLALGAVVGVMVTASHNPALDNGYKVYGANGAQIVPPTDTEIEAAIRAVGPTRSVPLSEDYVRLDDRIVEEYVDAVAALVEPAATPLRIVHTALHGVGTAVVLRVFERAGYDRPIPVLRQAEPDPDFPTVAFPNPEEPGALDLALTLARAESADLVIANDPDADRCAVAVNTTGPAERPSWRMLRGDETGVLLADSLMRKGVQGTYATTIVSSSMLGTMARARGFAYAETLTGFKWITRAAPDLVFGYEEALGYAVAPHLVLDKDGISAALLIAELAAELKAAGSSLPQRLRELYDEFGWYLTDQISLRFEDLVEITSTMARLRAAPPTQLLGHPVDVEDLLPATDGLTFRAPGARVVVRPSGTEPKLKAYLEVVAPDSPTATSRLADLRDEVKRLLGT